MPRLDFTRAFFQVGGFTVDGDRSFTGAQEAVAAALASAAPVVVIVSTDDRYPEAVPAIAAGVKAARPETLVVLAGLPKDHVESFKQAGIDEFIHVRADVPALLGGLADRMGVAS
jgi:methylmalonyl-CoA mutase